MSQSRITRVHHVKTCILFNLSVCIWRRFLLLNQEISKPTSLRNTTTLGKQTIPHPLSLNENHQRHSYFVQ